MDQENKVFKALMHPRRVAILEQLRRGEQCVCHLEAFLGYRQAYISQQLMVLREAGLVEDRRDGWNIFYHVTQPAVFALLDTARQITGNESGEPTGTQPAGRSKKPCPCPKCNPANQGSCG